MSFQRFELQCAVRNARCYSRSEKAVLMALISRADDLGSCWPAYEKLVDDTGYSRAAVAAALASLRERADGPVRIVVKHQGNRSGGRGPNKYFLGFHPANGLNQVESSPETQPPVESIGETQAPKVGGELSPKTGELSPKTGELSPANGLEAVQEALQGSTPVARARGHRPVVLPGLLDAKVKAKDWSVPQAFGAYAADLGLSQVQYSDVLADWREKINRAGEPPWLASQLCRFIEQKAGKLEAGVKSASAAPKSERREDWA